MRRPRGECPLLTLTAALVLAWMILPVTPALADTVTLATWASTPIRVGDKLFTLIATTFAGDGTVEFTTSEPYACKLMPGSDKSVYNETETLEYRVAVVDDPGTPANEAQLMCFEEVSGTGVRTIQGGTFTVTGLFDDNGDFSSPVVTFSNNGTSWGPSAVPGSLQALYVSLSYDAWGTTILTSHTTSFGQYTLPTPVEPATWGRVKTLYR